MVGKLELDHNLRQVPLGGIFPHFAHFHIAELLAGLLQLGLVLRFSFGIFPVQVPGIKLIGF